LPSSIHNSTKEIGAPPLLALLVFVKSILIAVVVVKLLITVGAGSGLSGTSAKVNNVLGERVLPITLVDSTFTLISLPVKAEESVTVYSNNRARC